MKSKLRALVSVRSLVAAVAILTFGAIGSYVLASSHALAPVPAKSATTLLKPYSLGTAPYQYIAYSGSLDQTRAATGIKQYFAAFVVNGPTHCTPAWGGAAANGLTSQRSADISSDIVSLRSAGGDVTLSFGGSNGVELASSCASVAELTAAYTSVIDTYALTQVDFDIEGQSLLDTGANARRAAAIAGLQKLRPNLKIWVTLPVTPKGLTLPGITVVKQLRDRGVVLAGVNIMAMNYNNGIKDMGQQAIDTAQESFTQLQQLYPASSASEIWKTIGITVMIGHNNTVPETFNLSDAPKLHTFAVSKGVGMLSIWNAGRDIACPETDPAAAAGSAPSISCSGVAQQPYDFLRALMIPAVH